jgi:hypothetical protein
MMVCHVSFVTHPTTGITKDKAVTYLEKDKTFGVTLELDPIFAS